MADRRRRRPSESEGEEGEEETLSTSQASLGSTEDPSHSGEDDRDRQSPCESEGEHAEALSEYESAEEDRAGEADEDSQAEQGDSDTEHEDTRADDDTETEETQETTEETQETGDTRDLDTSKSTVSTDGSDKGKKLERQSGDGSEAPDSEDQAENLDDDEDRRNPAFIPRKGDFFEHDIRGEEDDKQQGRPPVKGRRKLWQDEGKWQHDLFNEDEQRPKPVEELIAIYGYDPRRESSPDNIRPRRGRRPPRGGGRGGRPPPRTLRDFVERPPPPRRGFPPRNRTDVQTRNRAQYTQDVRQWAANTNNYRDNGPLDNVVSDKNRNQPEVSRQKPSVEQAVPNVINNVPSNPMPKNSENGVTVAPVPVKAAASTESEHQHPAPQEKRSYTRYRRSTQAPRTSPPQQQNIRKRMENLSLQPGDESVAQDRGHADGSPQHPEERHGPNRSDRPKRYSSLRQRPMPEQVVPPNMVKGVTYYNQGYRGEQFARGSTPPVVDGPIQPHPTGPPAPPHQGMIVSDVNLPPGMAHPAMYNPAMTMAPPVPPQLLPPPFFSAGGMVNYAAAPNPVSSYAPIPQAGPTAPTPNVPPVYTSPHPPSAQVVRGVTYFNNQMPPQVLKRSPARRPNAAIPIEPPPDVRGDPTASEEGAQPTEA
ncbi:nuclear-transcribed mRNA catabolic process, nonsense-mediated decay [Branchiostoma belcheri]|nr:nuclear-transcribed mRNA catabolic process, nonsense-mediated decay [Branchiostoma belcheri]